MRDELSEQEKWEWIAQQIRERGLPKRGRPKKGSDTVKWADLGVTRQQVHLWRKLAEIPSDDFEAYLSSPTRKRGSRRAILVHFGKINVVADDIYEETEIGRLARALLEPTERVLEEMNERQRFHLIRAMRYQLKAIAALVDLHSR
jgi:hypothetical protein